MPSPGPTETAVAAVLDWFTANARALPWRAPGVTPWGILVAEVMAHQTPVARVSPVWIEWLIRWPAPADLADAGPAAAITAWSGLGYPRRALHLVACAERIVRDHGGEVPCDPQVLRTLPGVGEYTAAAVACFAFGRRTIVLDTNVRRVLARLFDGSPGVAAHVAAAERSRAAAVLPADPPRAARWNEAVMELGALICTARTPSCPNCPVRSHCRWHRAGRPGEPPPRRPQGYTGTDRQARGRLLHAVITDGPVPAAILAGTDTVWPHAEQRQRALAGLVADGLLCCEDGNYILPSAPATSR